MRHSPSILLAAIVTLLAATVQVRSQSQAVPALPPPAAHQVDFASEVAPLFARSCARCHARGQSKGKFSLETRDRLLTGGGDGPAIVVGNSADSLLVHLVGGLDPDRPMPEKGTKLSAAEIGLVRAWIDQGAPWDDRVSFARQPPRNLDPTLPPLPPARGSLTHPVDRLLAAHDASRAATAPRADDRTLARRLSLDLVGLLPSPETVEAFVADPRPDKVEHYAATLLADRAGYAAHWLTFWNDLLRNDYRGPGYIDGGRRQISAWLHEALASNLPFDTFVSTLVNPGPESEGFTKGIVWRGVVNASQMPPMQAAQNVSQVFMGVNLKCASCHDSFINEWQLADAYGLAGVYADAPLEMVECDRPTGKTAPLKFLYPSLGTIDADAERDERLRQLAALMIDRRNGRLSRTIVNRLWARLFGRGLVEPQDDMDRAAWHPALLDWLAEDLVAHDFDLTHTLTRMVTSQAYQRAAVDVDLDAPPTMGPGASSPPPFSGPAIRRLTAEQFIDGVGAITGVWGALPAGDFGDDIAGTHQRPPVPSGWFWRPATGGNTGASTFRTTVTLEAAPAAAALLLVAPDGFTLLVGDERVAGAGRSTRPRVIDLGTRLRAGATTLTISVPALPAPTATGTAVAPVAALLAQLHVRGSAPAAPLRTLPLGPAAWRTSAGTRTDVAAVAVVPPPVVATESRELARALAIAALTGHTRAALTTASPLATALGRPGREQVVTVRTETPTTLQALELSNGDTLSRLLQRGATVLHGEPGATPSILIERIYSRALGRLPTGAERTLALELLGPRPGVESIEDLLWAVTMLPEFRLVH